MFCKTLRFYVKWNQYSEKVRWRQFSINWKSPSCECREVRPLRALSLSSMKVPEGNTCPFLFSEVAGKEAESSEGLGRSQSPAPPTEGGAGRCRAPLNCSQLRLCVCYRHGLSQYVLLGKSFVDVVSAWNLCIRICRSADGSFLGLACMRPEGVELPDEKQKPLISEFQISDE